MAAPDDPASKPADPDPHDDPTDDPMAPPKEPCECYCLHCGRKFMSDRMWFQRVINDPEGFPGFWMCPTNNCGGAGYKFDIFPVDPNHPDNEGWHSFDDDDDDDNVEGEFDDEDDEDDDDGVLADAPVAPADAAAAEPWDPAETKYEQLDDALGDAADDIIPGDEWKLGVAPDEPVPPQAYWPEEARKQWEEEQRRYDAPDERPRVLDWSDREDRKSGSGGGGSDIPF